MVVLTLVVAGAVLGLWYFLKAPGIPAGSQASAGNSAFVDAVRSAGSSQAAFDLARARLEQYRSNVSPEQAQQYLQAIDEVARMVVSAETALAGGGPDATMRASELLLSATTIVQYAHFETEAAGGLPYLLSSQLNDAFIAATASLRARIEAAVSGAKPPGLRRHDRFVMPCVVCGSPAIVLDCDRGRGKLLDLVGSYFPLDFADTPALRTAVTEPRPAVALEAHLMAQGLSGLPRYCSRCDRAYCTAHHHSRYGEGPEPQNVGSCPMGHATGGSGEGGLRAGSPGLTTDSLESWTPRALSGMASGVGAGASTGGDQAEWWEAEIGGVSRDLGAVHEALTNDRAGVAEAAAELVRAMSRLRRFVHEPSGPGADSRLAAELEGAFDRDAAALRSELERRLGVVVETSPSKPARRVDRYVLACELCGEDAAFLTDEGEELVLERLLPVVGNQPVRFTGVDQVRAALKAPDFGRRLHELAQSVVESGLHCYCPGCQRVYCERHYPMQSEWDGSWHQGTRATCALGHARQID